MASFQSNSNIPNGLLSCCFGGCCNVDVTIIICYLSGDLRCNLEYFSECTAGQWNRITPVDTCLVIALYKNLKRVLLIKFRLRRKTAFSTKLQLRICLQISFLFSLIRQLLKKMQNKLFSLCFGVCYFSKLI